jgi:8-oxo-dGTP pyrophosphatase MutT (NUDIX family)
MLEQDESAPPSDGNASRFPVSIKGVVAIAGKVVLLKNDRDEWELPGGKLEPGEEPASCVVREIHEELGLAVRADRILDSWVYNVLGKVEVLIVTYGCTLQAEAPIVISSEHKAVGLFSESEIEHLNMPSGYKNSIFAYFQRLHSRSI